MDTNISNVGAFVSSSSLLSNMIIFNDPAYLMLSIAGALLSLFGMLHDMIKRKDDFNILFVLSELIRAFIIGGILTPMLFMLYVHAGGRLIEFFTGFRGLDGIINSFWWLLALVSGWFAPLIWSLIIEIIIKAKDSTMRKYDDR